MACQLVSASIFIQSAKLISSADKLRPADNDIIQSTVIVLFAFIDPLQFAVELCSCTICLSSANSLQRGPGKESGPINTPSPPETTPLIISALPTSLVQILSNLSIPAAVASASGVQITVAPITTLLGPGQLSSSVQKALTSGGIPSAAASALVPIIVGSYDTTVTVPTVIPNSDAAAATNAADRIQRQHQASIEAFVQWLLHFFRLT
ncbi:MAG: hypothetical protein Q9213_005375 [Squamulea squamosa]